MIKKLFFLFLIAFTSCTIKTKNKTESTEVDLLKRTFARGYVLGANASTNASSYVELKLRFVQDSLEFANLVDKIYKQP